jgi:tricarballylate dehydrogenase
MIAADVVVVSAGNAGLVAALAAHEAGTHGRVGEREEPVLRRDFLHRLHRAGGHRQHAFGEQCGSAELGPGAPTLGRRLPDRLDERVGRTSRLRPRHRQVVGNVAVDAQVRRAVELGAGKLSDESSLGPDTYYELPPGVAIRPAEEGVGLVQSLFDTVEEAGIEVWYEAPG